MVFPPIEAAFVNKSCINEGDNGKSSCLVFDLLEPLDLLANLFRLRTSLKRTCDGLGERNSDSCNRWVSGVEVCIMELTGVDALKPKKNDIILHQNDQTVQ